MRTLKITGLLWSLILLSACKNGGSLSLESNAVKVSSPGSPFVQVNQGGKALVVQQGTTPTTGVHGWVTIQAVSSQNLNSGTGTKAVLNRTQAFQ